MTSAASATLSPTVCAPPGSAAGRGRGRGDAEVSREAILTAARRAFARQPYEAVTLKAIAADAGVSAPLVLKYFGSKERLFARAARYGEETDELFDAPLPELGAHLLRVLLDAHAHGRDPLIRVAFALQHGDLADLLRGNFREQVVARLRARLDGPDAALRAELVLAYLLGLGVQRHVVRAAAISVAERERIVRLCAPALQGLLDGTG
ncbi:Transcriptional regulator [Frankia canadensis]|uniref:Transcriptional regulator n=1 Tax=Frankia canadensis TaxID=1836972 RepID=A0A2I2KS60_9ACTN|nr:TetR family transcriptional regulator [Frankia canadensis]SNQ48507.1 Transcriptional regulator [Frankia canadensis]SOU55797.1 Transcriptional regulator [Frankia canadensis]